MPCQDAMVTNIIAIGPDKTVADALVLFKDNHIRALPVLNDEGELLGVFDFNALLNSLLPVSIPGMEGFIGVDLRLDHIIGAAPGVAKRLRKRMPFAVRDIMRHDYATVTPETPLWEGVRMLVKTGTIVPVLKKDTHKIVGILTHHSTIRQLLHLVQEQESEIKAQARSE